jgi:hypothetical protein
VEQADLQVQEVLQQAKAHKETDVATETLTVAAEAVAVPQAVQVAQAEMDRAE